MLMRWKRCFVVRCYVLPISAAKNEYIATALGHRPYGVKMILVGDISVNLSQPKVRDDNEDLMVMIVIEGME